MSQTRTEMKALLDRHGLSPRKQLGQHFLADANLIDKIVGLAGDPSDRQALEIGAGTGALTGALAKAGFAVTAYEIDPGLRPLLHEVLADTAVTLRFADAGDIGAADLAGEEWVLVANLPYNVGTPILLDLLRTAPSVTRFVVMVQREVAERLTATPGGKEYGLPSVVVGLFGSARREFRVPPQVFVPPPNVDSMVVSIDRTAAPDNLRSRAVEIAAAAFGNRRKMLRSSLRKAMPDPVAVLDATSIDPSLRAEQLAPHQYLDIARSLAG